MTKTTQQPLVNTIQSALESLKAQNVLCMNIASLTSITDTLVIASGTSVRHLHALATRVLERTKVQGFTPIGTEMEGEWLLIDFGDAVVHLMTKETRDYYQLEKLWQVPAQQDEVA